MRLGLMSALLGRELDVTWVAGRRGSLIGSIPSYAFGKVIEDHGQEFAETIMQQGLQCLSPARSFCSSAKVRSASSSLADCQSRSTSCPSCLTDSKIRADSLPSEAT